MEEQNISKTSRGKSIIKIILVIVGMIAFGALGFYFGMQDTFKVKDKVKKKSTENINIVIDHGIKEEKLTKDNLHNETYNEYDKLVSYYLLNTNMIHEFGAEGITLDSMSDENKLDVIFAAVERNTNTKSGQSNYTEEELFDKGYADNDEYTVPVSEIVKYAKLLFNIDEYNYLPESYNYLLKKYELVEDKYIGHLGVGGFESLGTDELVVTNVEKGDTIKVYVSEVLIVDDLIYRYSDNPSEVYENKNDIKDEYIFEFNNDLTFKSIVKIN